MWHRPSGRDHKFCCLDPGANSFLKNCNFRCLPHKPHLPNFLELFICSKRLLSRNVRLLDSRKLHKTRAVAICVWSRTHEHGQARLPHYSHHRCVPSSSFHNRDSSLRVLHPLLLLRAVSARVEVKTSAAQNKTDDRGDLQLAVESKDSHVPG